MTYTSYYNTIKVLYKTCIQQSLLKPHDSFNALLKKTNQKKQSNLVWSIQSDLLKSAEVPFKTRLVFWLTKLRNHLRPLNQLFLDVFFPSRTEKRLKSSLRGCTIHELNRANYI